MCSEDVMICSEDVMVSSVDVMVCSEDINDLDITVPHQNPPTLSPSVYSRLTTKI